MCNKRIFNTKDEARLELERIIETKYNPCAKRFKKPSRYYLCECGYFHLTSSVKITKY